LEDRCKRCPEAGFGLILAYSISIGGWRPFPTLSPLLPPAPAGFGRLFWTCAVPCQCLFWCICSSLMHGPTFCRWGCLRRRYRGRLSCVCTVPRREPLRVGHLRGLPASGVHVRCTHVWHDLRADAQGCTRLCFGVIVVCPSSFPTPYHSAYLGEDSFSSFGFQWPSELRSLFDVASASTGNEQLLAPECSVGSFGFSQKCACVSACARTCGPMRCVTVEGDHEPLCLRRVCVCCFRRWYIVHAIPVILVAGFAVLSATHSVWVRCFACVVRSVSCRPPTVLCFALPVRCPRNRTQGLLVRLRPNVFLRSDKLR
jgi:hypothetical protein